MEALRQWFRQHLWAAFLAHQAGLFIIVIVFLWSVRRITGRSIHLGKDPIGLGDGVTVVVLSIAVILLTNIFYRWVKGDDAPSLGISLTPRRLLELVIGLAIGWTFFIAPWASALWLGTASVHDRITAHFDNFSVGRILAVSFFMLLLQAIMEETTSRAFPMRLWEHRSLLFRMIVPSIFFVAIHLVSEQFSLERAGVLFMAGIVQSIAYALTGNIWFASGLHAGANIASFAVTGLWHAGAVVALVGNPTIPHWAPGVIMLAAFGAVFVLVRIYRQRAARHAVPLQLVV
ncbi:MAG TPA: CPBP family intramembrane glutamic endopeptidase [Pyrinomonadaceae bacterium]|nr:CPBP family intramembrane glutamic endopeptidase [Pyrinomonadaceae bacterium]